MSEANAKVPQTKDVSQTAGILSFEARDEVATFLARQLTETALYINAAYADASETKVLPGIICLFCETCDKDTNWETFLYPGVNDRAGFGNRQYTCRNCKEAKITYHYYWGSSTAGNVLFFKIGQWPALEERIPRELKNSLDRSSLNLYHKSLRCRNQGLGLGSLAYLRRVMEDKIGNILDMIAEEANGVGFAPDQVAKVKEVKTKGLFKDKIAVATAILPPSLRPGGHNPIDALHDLASDGLHRLSEAECIQVFDRVRFVFEYLFREIDARRRAAAEYAASVAKLASQRK